MKRLSMISIIIFSVITISAQTPQAFKYQAVVRNSLGEIIVNQEISVQISLLDGSPTGPAAYIESHNPTTNQYGLISLEVGTGDVVAGAFSNIFWGDIEYYLQVEIDETGGTNYLLMGASQILSVPMALHAETAEYAETAGYADNAGHAETAGYAEDNDWFFDEGNMYTNLTGSVGIGSDVKGTDVFTAKLQVVGDYPSTAGIEDILTLWRGSTQPITSGMGAGLTFTNEVANGAYALTARIASLTSDPIAPMGSLLFQTRPVSGNLNYAMIIDGDGRVGIGDFFPTAMLEVSVGDGNSDAFMLSSTDNYNGGLFIVKNSGNVGIGTKSPSAKLHVTGEDGILFTGTYGSGSIPVEGIGTRLMWYPKKAAFRAGRVEGTEWDDTNIGNYSTAMGLSSTASGYASTSMGGSKTASGEYSTAMGWITKAIGGISTAMGGSTEASGYASTSMGFSTTASGLYSTAMGYGTRASSLLSMAIGRFNVGGGTAASWVNTDPLFEIGNGADDANRANAVTILKNGNVGLGTTNPERILHLSGANPRLFIDASSSNPEINFKNSGDPSTSIWSIYKDGATDDLRFYQNGNRISIQSSTGNVSIGTTNPAGYRLNVAGTAYCSGGWQGSDKRYKEEIRDISNPLEKVMCMHGVSYAWKAEEYKHMGFPDGRHYGVIAQEIEQVLPEIVRTGPEGDKAVAYSELIPVMIEAMKELKAENEQLKARIEKLERK